MQLCQVWQWLINTDLGLNLKKNIHVKEITSQLSQGEGIGSENEGIGSENVNVHK